MKNESKRDSLNLKNFVMYKKRKIDKVQLAAELGLASPHLIK